MLSKLKNRFKIKLSRKHIFWSSLTIFIGVYIFLSLETVASGSKFALLEKEEQELIRKNKGLRAEIMETTSLIKISERSETLGFARPIETIYINQADTVAKLP